MKLYEKANSGEAGGVLVECRNSVGNNLIG